MKILNRPCVKNRPVRKGTGRRFSYGSTVSFSEHMRLRAAPQHSARAFGERFFVETRFEKCRCTLCTRKGHAASVRRQSRQRLRNTSNFSNRWIGEKYPAKAEAAIVRGCPNYRVLRMPTSSLKASMSASRSFACAWTASQVPFVSYHWALRSSTFMPCCSTQV